MMAPAAKQSAQRKAYLNANIVAPAQGLNGKGGILIEDGWILAAGPKVTKESIGAGTASFDCAGATLIPGLIDMRVFTGEPGTEYRETLATASEAAAAGGVTTMIVMPNTQPVIDDAAIVDFILRRARDTAIVRVAPMAAITKGLAGELMTEIGSLKEAGAVAVTDGTQAVANANLFRRALTYAKDFDMLVVQHVEEPSLSTGVMNASRNGFAAWPCRQSGDVGSDHAGARSPPRRNDRRPLSRLADFLRDIAGGHSQRQGQGPAGDLRRFHSSSDAQRKRHRRLPHLLQTLAALAHARMTGAPLWRAWPTEPSM